MDPGTCSELGAKQSTRDVPGKRQKTGSFMPYQGSVAKRHKRAITCSLIHWAMGAILIARIYLIMHIMNIAIAVQLSWGYSNTPQYNFAKKLKSILGIETFLPGNSHNVLFIHFC